MLVYNEISTIRARPIKFISHLYSNLRRKPPKAFLPLIYKHYLRVVKSVCLINSYNVYSHYYFKFPAISPLHIGRLPMALWIYTYQKDLLGRSRLGVNYNPTQPQVLANYESTLRKHWGKITLLILQTVWSLKLILSEPRLYGHLKKSLLLINISLYCLDYILTNGLLK